MAMPKVTSVVFVMVIGLAMVSLVAGTAGTATFYTPPYTPSKCHGFQNDGTMIAAGSDVFWRGGSPCDQRYEGNEAFAVIADPNAGKINIEYRRERLLHRPRHVTLQDSKSTSHGGQPINTFQAFALSHKGKATSDVQYNPEDPPKTYNNTSVHTHLTAYSHMAKKVELQAEKKRREELEAMV
ncbi:hypothetical protein PR202_ga12615 [Eleusine coracana subsp. coracana]|uniref:Uncharacterized protein n=1 Tax=Eleusine coracana subsp. coracana TaxID=191504 RepID=A0AAV5CCK6_ELECO|nr:hypothetical protein PR202_ga12615 [Eleusine coracana subsp. coracana]